MKMTFKALVGMLLALCLAGVGGWVWGSLGRWSADEALRLSGTRLHQSSAQGHLLQARVNLFENNFGEAGQNLTAARADLQTVALAADEAGQKEAAGRLRTAIAKIGEAIDLAARLDLAANARAADALRLLTADAVTRDDVLRAFETSVAHPASARELIQILKVPREERVTFRRHLRSLAADGVARPDPRAPLRPPRQDGRRRRAAPGARRRLRLRDSRASRRPRARRHVRRRRPT